MQTATPKPTPAVKTYSPACDVKGCIDRLEVTAESFPDQDEEGGAA